MSKYIISPDGKLYHADDYLQHWKYIKREKLPNGKYKYYYDIGQNEKRTADRASAETNFSKALLQVVMANKAEYQKKRLMHIRSIIKVLHTKMSVKCNTMMIR